MTDTERTIDKVLKLLAKAESTTPEEAEALTEKAAELMRRAAIDDAMLAAAQGKQTDEIVEREIRFRGSYYLGNEAIANAVGKGMGFKTLVKRNWDGTNTTRSCWIGWKSELDAAEMLLTSLLIQAERAGRQHIKETGYFLSGHAKFKERRSFLFGFADAVHRRIAAGKKAAEFDARREAGESSGMELVLLSRDEQVKTWFDEKYAGSLRKQRTRLEMTGSYASGRAAGARADLGGTGVGSSVRGEIG